MGNIAMKQVDTLIRAKTPVVAITTGEETRAIQELQVIAAMQKKSLWVWTVATGFTRYSPEPDKGKGREVVKSPDPLASLMRVVNDIDKAQVDGVQVEQAIWTFCDIHKFLSNPAVLRALRDVAHRVREVKGVSIVLLGVNFSFPEDVKKEVAIVDFPLPTGEELDEQVSAFIEKLPEYIKVDLKDSRNDLVKALKGLTEDEADNVLSQAVITNRVLDERAVEFVMRQKAQIIRESGALEFYPAKVSYSEIGGLDLLKAWAAEVEKASTPQAKEFGVESPKSALLVGVPGCGKSLTAKAIAGSSRPLLRFDIGAAMGSHVGQSESQIRTALKVAEAVAPCVLWIDEIEKALGVGGGETDGGTSLRVLGTILTWMQENTAEVFVVATANDVSAIRPELIRRFETKFFVDLPDDASRSEILAIHIGKRRRSVEAFDMTAIVGATAGFTGSELEEIVKAGMMRAFGRGASDVETQDFLTVIEQTVPLSTTMQEQIEHMRKWATRARPASSKQTTGHNAVKPSTLLEFD